MSNIKFLVDNFFFFYDLKNIIHSLLVAMFIMRNLLFYWRYTVHFFQRFSLCLTVMCLYVDFFGFIFLWGREEKGMIEDKLVGWHHQLSGHEFETAPGNCEGQGSLVCYSPWGHRIRHDWATEHYSLIFFELRYCVD